MAELLVNIDVPDLAAGERFYCAAFGLRPGRRFGGGFLELLGAAAPLYLLVQAEGTPPWPGASVARGYAPHWTPVHLDFAVPALEAAVERALAAGATRQSAPIVRNWGRMVLLRDPFGHGICLLEFTAQGYDAIATG